MEPELSRRHALAALGVTTSAIAGCLDVFSGDETDVLGGDEDSTAGGSGEEGSNADGPNGTDSTWPAIDHGELLSDFEDLDRWSAQVGRIEPVSEEARTGTQAALVESDERTAGMSLRFPDGLDLEGWDTSIAVKPEAATQIVVEFIAPTRDERLTTVRAIPDGYDDWFRLDCGYEHKPAGEPDLTNVTRLNVVAVGPEDGPTRMLVDDLRRTEAAENGKAILAFYDGHRSHFDVAAPMLEERGWAGTVPVDPRRVGGGNRMDFDELHELRDRGWDVCSYPRGDRDLTEQSADRQRRVVEGLRDSLADHGFPDGSRHFFAPAWRRLTPTTLELVRDSHESGFLFGSCPTGVPPTGIHTTPVIWGPALHNGVRRHINLCDQYNQLTVLRIPPIVDDEDADESSMSIGDFEHLLDHLEHRGLDVVTPSDVVDGRMDRTDSGRHDSPERPDGQFIEPGESHVLEGSGPSDSPAVELSEGPLIGRFSHNGESTFEVEATPVDGTAATERFVTATRPDGESVTIVEDGTYEMSVEAEGAWSITLDQPGVHGDDLTAIPVERDGTGSAVVGPLWTDGPLSVGITHDGAGPIIVDGYGVDGSWEQLVNQTGEFDNSRSYDGIGVVWIAIEASGDWTLELTATK